MARKKIENIIGLGNNEDKLVVSKSLPLFALWRSELTLAEFKILDTYLARIDSHKPDKRVVVFNKGELEEKLGVKKINKRELEERLKHLMGNVVKIPDIGDRKGFRLITLFEEAVAEPDEYGLWTVKLECTQKAMKYIFNCDHLGYLRYKLRCITSISSRYTYILFTYLEHNRYRKSWQVSLEELKEMLGCEDEETYKEFKRFNDRLLKRVHQEMHEKTECKYSYEPIKKGRSVVAIKFTVETLPKAIEEDVDENQINLEDFLEEQAKRERPMYLAPLEVFNFDEEQLDELQSLIATVPNHKLPQQDADRGNIELNKYHYFDQKAKEIIRRDKAKRINSKFAYLVKLMKEDSTS